MTERDRQNQTLRTLENEHASRQLEESEMKNKMKDRESLGKEIQMLAEESANASVRLKVCYYIHLYRVLNRDQRPTAPLLGNRC